MSLNIHHLRCLLAVAMLCALSACSSTSSSKLPAVQAELVGTDTVRYAGDLIPVDRFARALKKAGYPVGFTVRLQVPEKASNQVMHTVKQTVQQGGYPVILHRPTKTYSGPPSKSGRPGGRTVTLDEPRVLSGGGN